jgi:type I restriction enzyme S subunit
VKAKETQCLIQHFEKEPTISSRHHNDYPADWRFSRLDEICLQIQSGFASGERSEDGVIQLRMNNISPDGRIVCDSLLRVPVPANLSQFTLDDGDVIFNNTNSVDLIGKTAIFKGMVEPCTFSNHLTRIRVDLTKTIPEWILYHFIRKWEQGEFKRICQRHVGQAGIGGKDLNLQQLPLPPLPEQQRIATVLATVDEAIAATDAVITRLESLTETLESSLVVRGVEIADLTISRIGRIPNHWKTATIGMLSKVQGGIQKTKDRIPKSNYYRYLTVAHVQRKRILLNDPRFFEASKEELEKYRLKIGDILIIEGNGNPDQVGRAALFRGEITDCIYQNHIIRIRINADLIIPDYAIAFINSSHGREQIKLLGMSSSGLYTLSTNRIRSIVLPLPPLPEQRRIAAILSSLDDRLATERAERDRLVTLKKGLMQVLLTGRVRVPPGVAEEVAPAHV